MKKSNISTSGCLARCALPAAFFYAVLLCISSPLYAESRALIIGVGEYENEDVNDLPGLDIDVDIMKRVATNLGYKESSVLVLQDEEATIDNIVRGLDQWLVEGVEADDQVLIYFTGHGAQMQDQNSDEDDGLDEFFLAHDFQVKNNVAEGALVDDDFYKFLSRIPTENILLVVDACHSGTGFKSFNGALTGSEGGIAKYHAIGKEIALVDGSFAAGEKGSSARFVALMSSDDTETSIATSRGSVFTLGIEQALKDSLGQGRSATPLQIIESTRTFVRQELSTRPELIFTPQIGGDSDLLSKPLQLIPATTLRDDLLATAEPAERLSISTNKQQFSLGDRSLTVNVEVPADGYLNIVTVDPNDSGMVLYPNKFNQDNYVAAGMVTLPTREMSFDLEAQGPIGEHLVIAFWSTTELNMYTEGKGARDANGELTDVFSELSSYTTTRNFTPVARKSTVSSGAGWITVNMIQ